MQWISIFQKIVYLFNYQELNKTIKYLNTTVNNCTDSIFGKNTFLKNKLVITDMDKRIKR